MKQPYKTVEKERLSYYKKHSYNRAMSRFGFDKEEIAKILRLIKREKYVNKFVSRGRIIYELWFNDDQVRVVYDKKLKQIVTFLYDEEVFEELDNNNYKKGLDENIVS